MDSLLILDLDGTLVLRQNKRIIKRKGLSEFLLEVLSLYKVGIFTSMLTRNMTLTLRDIMTPDQINDLEFVWDREYTSKDPDGPYEWSTIKTLESLELLPNLYKNVLIVDDDPRKLRQIPDENKLECPSFKDENEEEEVLKELLILIKRRLNSSF